MSLVLLLLLQGEAPSFAREQRIAATYYYCRPDAKAAVECLEMGKAGIDLAAVALDGPIELLDDLVAALDALQKQSREFPLLAPFLSPDATLDFSAALRFWERVPARHHARIDGRPLLWLGPAPRGANPGRAAFDAALAGLPRPPYLIADVSWTQAPADRVVAWGGARGLMLDVPVVSVGPGALDPPRDREDGQFYDRMWYKALKLEPKMVVIETWNGAGDGVSETPPRKRKYLEATKRHVRDFKVDTKSVLPKGKWTAERQVAFTTKYFPHEQGLRPIAVDDGPFDEIRLYGFTTLTTKETKGTPVRKLCFDVDDSFCFFDRKPFEVAVEFLDVGEGSFTLEYDSFDRTIPPAARIVKPAGTGTFTGTGEWRTELFQLPDAAFGNGQPGGSDFRIVVEKRGIAVRAVMVLRK